jgi:hypothetical protein
LIETTPTESSANLITSGAVYSKLDKIATGTNAKMYAYTRTQTSGSTATQDSLEIDTVPTESSANLITSGAVYSHLLNYTENTFGFSTNQTINTTAANLIFNTQTDSNNSKVYLSSNNIVIHSTVKLIFITFYYYASVTGSKIYIRPTYIHLLQSLNQGSSVSDLITGIVHGAGTTENLTFLAGASTEQTTLFQALTYFKIGVLY